MIISNSEVSDFLKCQQYWWYKYILRLTPKGHISGPLAYGIYGHEWLSEYYLARANGGSKDDAIGAGNTAIGKLLVENKIDNEFALHLMSILLGYIEAYPDKNFEIIGVEQIYIAQLSDDISIGITVDVVGRATDGQYAGETFVLDHKFTYNFWSPNRVSFSPQLVKYIYTLRANGLDVNRGLLNQLRYRQMKNGNELFRRTPVAPSEIRINNVMSQHVAVSVEIFSIKKAYQEEARIFEPIKLLDGKTCENCIFVPICEAEINGKKTETTIKAHYTVNDDEYITAYEVLE
jgi:hypothetical protein